MPEDPARDVSMDDVIVVVPEGRLTAERVMATCRHIVSHPDFRPGMPSLWDLRDADLSPLGRPELIRIQEFLLGLSSRRGSARVALVAPTDLAFGISRMFEAHRTPDYLDFHVFRSRQNGMDWLAESGQEN